MKALHCGKHLQEGCNAGAHCRWPRCVESKEVCPILHGGTMSRVPAHEHETSADIRVAVTFQQHWAQQALHWVSSSCFYLRL